MENFPVLIFPNPINLTNKAAKKIAQILLKYFIELKKSIKQKLLAITQ